jgi:hypothetical protein
MRDVIMKPHRLCYLVFAGIVWGEFTDNGPATGYNYLTMACVALYWEHSDDKAALEALRRATTFHKYFTWPDGTPVVFPRQSASPQILGAWKSFALGADLGGTAWRA